MQERQETGSACDRATEERGACSPLLPKNRTMRKVVVASDSGATVAIRRNCKSFGFVRFRSLEKVAEFRRRRSDVPTEHPPPPQVFIFVLVLFIFVDPLAFLFSFIQF